MLAGFQARLKAEDDARRLATRRAWAAAGVAVVHVAFIFFLIASQWLPASMRIKPPEPLMWLQLQPAPAKAQTQTPVTPRHKAPAWMAPTFVMPKVIRPPEEENNAIDLGLALGRSLACGANSFEYLTPRQQAACIRQPWHFVYDHWGNIVLDAQPRRVEQEKPRPSDIQAHERNTAPSCPKYIDPNAPCLSDIVPGMKP